MHVLNLSYLWNSENSFLKRGKSVLAGLCNLKMNLFFFCIQLPDKSNSVRPSAKLYINTVCICDWLTASGRQRRTGFCRWMSFTFWIKLEKILKASSMSIVLLLCWSLLLIWMNPTSFPWFNPSQYHVRSFFLSKEIIRILMFLSFLCWYL